MGSGRGHHLPVSRPFPAASGRGQDTGGLVAYDRTERTDRGREDGLDMATFPGGGLPPQLGPFIQMLMLGFQMGKSGGGGSRRQPPGGGAQPPPGPAPIPATPGPFAGAMNPAGLPPTPSGMARPPIAAPGPMPVPPAAPGVGGAAPIPMMPPPGAGGAAPIPTAQRGAPQPSGAFVGPPPPGFTSWEAWYAQLPPEGKLRFKSDYENYLMGGDQAPPPAPSAPLTPP
jgi:hypothetical protein